MGENYLIKRNRDVTEINMLLIVLTRQLIAFQTHACYLTFRLKINVK